MEQLHRDAIAALADASRRLAESLDVILSQEVPLRAEAASLSVTEPTSPVGGSLPVWDPEFDTPLVLPKVKGARAEEDWCVLTYLGAIYAINRRHGRGATRQEVSRYAVKAGYMDGRAVTAWSKGSGPTFSDEAKQRWIKPGGVDYWVRGKAEALGVRLPDDLATPWDGPHFH